MSFGTRLDNFRITKARQFALLQDCASLSYLKIAKERYLTIVSTGFLPPQLAFPHSSERLQESTLVTNISDEYIEDRTKSITENSSADRLEGNIVQDDTHSLLGETNIKDTENLFYESNVSLDDSHDIDKTYSETRIIPSDKQLFLFKLNGLFDEPDLSYEELQNLGTNIQSPYATFANTESFKDPDFLSQIDVDALLELDKSDKPDDDIIRTIDHTDTAGECKPLRRKDFPGYRGLFGDLSSSEESDDDLGFGLFSDEEESSATEKSKSSQGDSHIKQSCLYNTNTEAVIYSEVPYHSVKTYLPEDPVNIHEDRDAKQGLTIDTFNKNLESESDFVSPFSDANMECKPFVRRSESEIDWCVICMDKFNNPRILHKCSHQFCQDCINTYFKVRPQCPVCFVAYGVIKGNQPKDGTMSDTVNNRLTLPGYEKYKTIVIYYQFPDGTQTEEHPNPGQQYWGTSRTAYLPNSSEGQKVLRLLKEAFKRRLVFTVGRSRTTGCDNQVTWNDIHHKTSPTGGQHGFGYPDPTYLSRVQEELAAFGVTEESIRENT